MVSSSPSPSHNFHIDCRSHSFLHQNRLLSRCAHWTSTSNQLTTPGPNTPPTHPLLNTTKTPLCAVILGTAPRTIETVQALLIDACYSEKGWLLTSMALKLALELDLPESYRKLSSLILGADQTRNDEDGGARQKEEERLMRETRVWFGVWVLEHM